MVIIFILIERYLKTLPLRLVMHCNLRLVVMFIRSSNHLKFYMMKKKKVIMIERDKIKQLANELAKILNEASNESLSVRDNEQSKEDCSGCYHIKTCRHAVLNKICRYFIDNTQSD